MKTMPYMSHGEQSSPPAHNRIIPIAIPIFDVLNNVVLLDIPEILHHVCLRTFIRPLALPTIRSWSPATLNIQPAAVSMASAVQEAQRGMRGAWQKDMRVQQSDARFLFAQQKLLVFSYARRPAASAARPVFDIFHDDADVYACPLSAATEIQTFVLMLRHAAHGSHPSAAYFALSYATFTPLRIRFRCFSSILFC
jgi:hypothetical protein